MKWYIRFCASINFFFEKKMKYNDADIFTFNFILLLTIVYFLGGKYLFELLIGRILKLSTLYYFVIGGVIALFNYLFVFRKYKLQEYYNNKLNSVLTIFIILFGYLLMLIGGQIARLHFYGY